MANSTTQGVEEPVALTGMPHQPQQTSRPNGSPLVPRSLMRSASTDELTDEEKENAGDIDLPDLATYGGMSLPSHWQGSLCI